MTGDDVVRVARNWVGTPYVHRGCAKGCGADCLGLVLGVWREAFGTAPNSVPIYSPDWSEPQGLETLEQACKDHLQRKPILNEALGDVLLFRMKSRSVAKHLGVQSQVGGAARFVHAYSGHGVVESSLSGPWFRRIVGRFAFPSIRLGDL